MGLHFFNSSLLNTGTQLNAVDTGSGTGSQVTYSLINKTALQMGGVVQADALQYYQFNGGFTKNITNNTVTLSTPPPNGSSIVFPGLTQLLAQAFDSLSVPGVTNPNVVQVPFWMGDFNQIHLYQYENTPNNSGIGIGLVNLVPALPAPITWCQLAPDNLGTPGAFLASGQELYTPNISAFSTLSASSAAGASSIYVATSGDAATFIAGDYIILNIGYSTQEIVQILSINVSQSLLVVSGTNYPHYIGETVFTCARQFWLQVTIPPGVANNTAVNFFNVSLYRQGQTLSRT